MPPIPPHSFQKLLRFYHDCIEEEDRHSLTRKVGARGNSLASPWSEREVFFHEAATQTQIEPTEHRDTHALSRRTDLELPERWFYGYPLFLYPNGIFAPLFFAEVSVERRGEAGFVVRPVQAGEICLNHHLLRKRGTSPEEITAIQAELEGDDYGSFAHRMRAAFDHLAEAGTVPPQAPLDPYPTGNLPGWRWVNRPVLFRSEHSDFNKHLLAELKELAGVQGLDAKISQTALAGLLGWTPIPTGPPPELPFRLLQVCPLNQWQEEAARAAMTGPITVVTGPPGTGKSQVVVDLLASAALAGKPVLFASKNNKAVDVVLKRLREILGPENDFVLRLGKSAVAQQTLVELPQRLAAVRNRPTESGPAPAVVNGVEQRIARLRKAIEEIKGIATDWQARELDQRAAQTVVREAWVVAWLDSQETTQTPLDLARIERLAERLDALAGEKLAGFWLLRWWREFLRARRLPRLRQELSACAGNVPANVREQIEQVCAAATTNPSKLVKEAHALADAARWRGATAAAQRQLENLLGHRPAAELAAELETAQSELAKLAACELRVGWAGNVRRHLPSIQNALTGYSALQGQVANQNPVHRNQFKVAVERLGKDLPVWIVTNLSTRRAMPLVPGLFDLIIIDEASQCDVASALPLLFRAKRALIIGDPHQLQHICTLKAAEEQELAEKNNIQDLLPDWSYMKTSLYKCAAQVWREAKREPIFLAEHYRSSPEIIEFSNTKFYQGQLVLRTKLEPLRERLGNGLPLGVFWHDLVGMAGNTPRSARNDSEVEAVVALLDQWFANGPLQQGNTTVGVVTPFRLQHDAIERIVQRRRWWEQAKDRLVLGTAHKFQGDECDLMILSPVVTADMQPHLKHWVAHTDELLNVAITRARGALHVVGDRQACQQAGGILGEFAASVGTGAETGSQLGHLNLAEQEMASLLHEAGLWHKPQYEVLNGRYRLDFLAVGPLGFRYDIEVDGRRHLTDAHIQADRIRDDAVQSQKIKIVRIEARHVFDQRERVLQLLRRLV